MILLLLVGSYFLGNILTGSIISKIFYKKELHKEGSGNPGARNAGRLFGKKAFVITFLGDALKGVLAVTAVRLLGFNETIELIALFSVILGHVFPAVHKFRGGKGISTFIGGILVVSPFVFAVFVGVFLLLYPFIKNFAIAGLTAIFSVPIIMLLFSYTVPNIVVACLISGLVLLVHRKNLKEKNSGKKEASL